MNTEKNRQWVPPTAAIFLSTTSPHGDDKRRAAPLPCTAVLQGRRKDWIRKRTAIVLCSSSDAEGPGNKGTLRHFEGKSISILSIFGL